MTKLIDGARMTKLVVFTSLACYLVYIMVRIKIGG